MGNREWGIARAVACELMVHEKGAFAGALSEWGGLRPADAAFAIPDSPLPIPGFRHSLIQVCVRPSASMPM